MHESAWGHELPYRSDDAIAAALNHGRSQGLHQSASCRATLPSARLYESPVRRSASRPVAGILDRLPGCCGAPLLLPLCIPCITSVHCGAAAETAQEHFPTVVPVVLSPRRSHAAHCICVLCATSCVRLWIVSENNGTFFPSLKEHLNHLALGRKTQVVGGGTRSATALRQYVFIRLR